MSEFEQLVLSPANWKLGPDFRLYIQYFCDILKLHQSLPAFVTAIIRELMYPLGFHVPLKYLIYSLI